MICLVEVIFHLQQRQLESARKSVSQLKLVEVIIFHHHQPSRLKSTKVNELVKVSLFFLVKDKGLEQLLTLIMKLMVFPIIGHPQDPGGSGRLQLSSLELSKYSFQRYFAKYSNAVGMTTQFTNPDVKESMTFSLSRNK